MCCKRYYIIFSTFSLKFKCKICVQKEVIRNFQNHILVTWPATNLLILWQWCRFQITFILFRIWPTNHFLKAKSYNFHFHKNDVTWPLSANGLLVRHSSLLRNHRPCLKALSLFLTLLFIKSKGCRPLVVWTTSSWAGLVMKGLISIRDASPILWINSPTKEQSPGRWISLSGWTHFSSED